MVDAWSSTPPSAQEFPHTPTNGFDALLDRIAKYERVLADMRNNLLSTAGLSVSPDGLTVTSSLDVSGDLNATGSASFGGTLTVTGDAVFSGDLAVPNGSITNDALASPLTARAASPAWANNWSGGGSWATKASTSIAVPAGYTQAVVIAASSVTVVGSLIRYDIRTGIAGGYGSELQNLVDGVDSSSIMHTRTLTGLSGGSLSIEAQVLTAPALAAHTGNIATVTGMAVFFR